MLFPRSFHSCVWHIQGCCAAACCVVSGFAYSSHVRVLAQNFWGTCDSNESNTCNLQAIPEGLVYISMPVYVMVKACVHLIKTFRLLTTPARALALCAGRTTLPLMFIESSLSVSMLLMAASIPPWFPDFLHALVIHKRF